MASRVAGTRSFQDFQIETLKYYECLVLNKIAFSVSPQITPIAFVREFLLLWRPEADNSELTELADFLIALVSMRRSVDVRLARDAG